jgi:prepilin signal peptidase PulO-like enzyme (type II secretory pathway)
MCLLPFGILPVYCLVIILVIGSSPTRRYNYLDFSITFPQTSCSKLFSVASFESLLCSLSSSSGAL